MQLDPQSTSPSQIYSTMIRAITPRPIAWVSTISPNGITNLAPFSYFNGICSDPATLMFSAVNQPDGSPKDTVVNIEATQQFVVNIVPFELASPMLQTASNLAYEDSEFDATNLKTKPSIQITPPRVAESPIQFECELHEIVRIGEGPLAANVIFGNILLIHVDDRVLGENGKIDPDLVNSIGRMGGQDYCQTSNRFQITISHPSMEPKN